MKLSIVIPVFNGEKYLNNCMQSIIREITEDIEVLLFDDGSNDGSYELMTKYNRKNIRLFQHENQGVSYTRNRGIKESKGDYIMFVDADDTLIEGWSKFVLDAIKKQSDIYYFSKKFKNETATKSQMIDNLFMIKTDYKIENLSAPWSKLFRRQFLLTNDILFDERLINGEDAIFNLKCIISTENFECIKESIYMYRIYSGSSTKRFNVKFFNANLEFLKLAKHYLTEGKIGFEKQNRYLAKSFIYSTYLYLFLISFLSNQTVKKQALQRFKYKEMREYMKIYKTSKDCSFIVNFIYFFIRNNMTFIALLLIKVRNIIKKRKTNTILWEEN